MLQGILLGVIYYICNSRANIPGLIAASLNEWTFSGFRCVRAFFGGKIINETHL